MLSGFPTGLRSYRSVVRIQRNSTRHGYNYCSASNETVTEPLLTSDPSKVVAPAAWVAIIMTAATILLLAGLQDRIGNLISLCERAEACPAAQTIWPGLIKSEEGMYGEFCTLPAPSDTSRKRRSLTRTSMPQWDRLALHVGRGSSRLRALPSPEGRPPPPA